MKNQKLHSLSLLCLFALSPIALAADEALAVVNGMSITKAHLDAYKVGRTSATTTDKSLLDELINLELLAQEAKTKGVADRPAIAAEIDNQRRSTLSNALVRDILAAKPVTDDEVREAYQKRLSELPKNEFKLSILITDDELLAGTLRDEASKGTKFDELKARPGVKPSSGQANWMRPDQMPPEIAQALIGAKKGDVADQPVKTRAGWHVLVVDDTRPFAPPSFEAVKDQIRPILENNRIILHIQAAKENAKITTNLP